MPVLSRFCGLVIYMHYREHGPAQFHARYQGFEVVVGLSTGAVAGRMPRRALSMVFDWMDLHRAELRENWTLAAERLPLRKIEPLP